MRLTVDRQDLLPYLHDVLLHEIKFGDFRPEVQAAIVAAKSAQFQDRVPQTTYKEIYPPRSDVHEPLPSESRKPYFRPYRISDVVAIIEQMVTSSDDNLAAHGRTLEGPRTRGSTTAVGLEGLHDYDLEILDVPRPDVAPTDSADGGPRYLTVWAAGIGGRLGACPYHEVLCPTDVKRREGAHGPELYLDRSIEVTHLTPTDQITIIMGPPNEYPGFPDGVVYTWHPGPPLAVLKPGEEPGPWTAVKLHNG